MWQCLVEPCVLLLLISGSDPEKARVHDWWSRVRLKHQTRQNVIEKVRLKKICVSMLTSAGITPIPYNGYVSLHGYTGIQYTSPLDLSPHFSFWLCRANWVGTLRPSNLCRCQINSDAVVGRAFGVKTLRQLAVSELTWSPLDAGAIPRVPSVLPFKPVTGRFCVGFVPKAPTGRGLGKGIPSPAD